ncbi:PAS domain-containing sensor histidine kinase [Massilia arenosa]|uniref:histidine kinase n=1 Tax=Zemynaea arenosa TaxID=2561931 RepID=A0A4Y9SJ92_9BURK|nr:PAS domain-containing sensor histidine kinase [Massilia arenosa]TFW25747.1 PAS domain-containing sensor histidine kinase [Massilia arenosa]
MNDPDPHAAQYDRAPAGLLVATPEGRILDVNSTLCAWLGYSRGELLECRGMSMLLTIGGRLFHQTHLAPLLQMQGSVAEVQLELRHKDGQKLPVLTSIVRVRLPQQARQDEYAFMLSRDRKKYEQELLAARQRAETALDERRSALQALSASDAELRRLNSQLALANQRKEEFLAILGHELRNPLAALANAVELMRLRGGLDPQLRRLTEVFERQIGTIEHLSSDLMDAARIGQGKMHLDMARVTVGDVMQRAHEMAAPRFAAAGQQLVLVAGPDALVEVDMVRLVQVTGNLLSNACKYNRTGGTTWLSHGREGGQAVFRVRDDGPGIDPARLGHIFTMFEQLDAAPDRAQGGIGIGLALVKGLVELHGGTVAAASDGLGHGCTFTVTLPLAA